MHLKRIEMEDFKSFRGEVVVDLELGFVAITGPNGSGKSNCGDAIQFVLGPRSNKVLRADKVADLIFNGGERHKPAKACRVALVFHNPMGASGHRRLPVDRDEVRMERSVRLLPSGSTTTSYRLDGEESTQGTFRRLLASANARPDGYNIVLQGDVTGLANMTPFARRKVLDEVAGVASYDEEITKAQRQRGRVEEFLERIRLLEEELSQQRANLAVERTAALEAREVKQELDEAKVTLMRVQVSSLRSEIAFTTSQRTTYLEEAEDLRSDVRRQEGVLIEMDERIADLDRRIADLLGEEGTAIQQRIANLRVAVARSQDAIESHQSRLEAGGSEQERLAEQRKRILEEVDELAAQVSTAVRDREASESMLAQAREAEDEVQASLNQHDDGHRTRLQDLEMGRQHLEQARSTMSACNEAVTVLRTKLEVAIEDLARNEARVATRSLDVDDLEVVGEEFGQQDPDAERTRLRLELAELVRNESSLAEQKRTIDAKVHEAMGRLAEAEAQARTTTQGGFGAGVSAILAARDGREISGILGTLSELCVPRDPAHGEALAVALGGRMHSVIVESDAVAEACIEHLRRNKLGRASFLPLNKVVPVRPNGRTVMISRKEGVLGFGFELLEYDPRIEPAVRMAMGNALLVDTLGRARRMMGGVRLVTLSGDLIESSGGMHGGSRRRTAATFGGRGREAKELERVRSDLDRLMLIKDTAEGALRACRDQQRALQDALNELASDDHASRRAQWLEQLRHARHSLDEARAAVSVAERTMRTIEHDLDASESRAEEARVLHSQAQATLEVARRAVEQGSPEHLQRKLLEVRELRHEAHTVAERAGTVLQHAESARNDMQERLETTEAAIEALQQEMADHQADLSRRLSQLDTEETELVEVTAKQGTFAKEQQGLDRQRTALVNDAADLRAALAQRSQEARHRVTLADQLGRTLEERTIDLKELSERMVSIGLDPDEAVDNLPTQRDIERSISKLERRLDAVGEVNMLAIEQYERCEERLVQLASDAKHLSWRRTSLIEVTEALESQRSERLVTVLDQVNANFETVYRVLSDGGDASLVLESPEDPFSGGLRMMATPKGKSNRSNLQALSGGERSIAAMALIFAIQDYDPSPFYFFDEVDQNLDAHNAEAIAAMCQSRSRSAQFIMVTLRKVSLQFAEHHIGVTHAGDGVSRIIQEFDRDAALELGAAAEQEARSAKELTEAGLATLVRPVVPDEVPLPSSLGGSSRAFDGLATRAEDPGQQEMDDPMEPEDASAIEVDA